MCVDARYDSTKARNRNTGTSIVYKEEYHGLFVIRTEPELVNGAEVEIGRVAVLSPLAYCPVRGFVYTIFRSTCSLRSTRCCLRR